MRIVKERKLSEFYIKMKIISLIAQKDLFFSEIWEEMKGLIGSKATLNKYLEDLKKRKILKTSKVKGKKGKHRVYYKLVIIESQILREYVEKIKKDGQKIDSKKFVEYVQIITFTTLINLSKFKETWHIGMVFNLALLLDILGDIEIKSEEIKTIVEREQEKSKEIKFLEEISKLSKLFLRSIT